MELHDIERTVNQIDEMLQDLNYDWDTLVTKARNIMASLTSTFFFGTNNRLNLQVHTVHVLQSLAFQNVDSDGLADIAEWCLERWLQILQYQPNNMRALRGVGQWWLSKAQPYLTRTHAWDGTSSSSEEGRRRVEVESMGLSDSQEELQFVQATEEADLRLHTADYVEARGILLPATEYLRRAVEEAINQSTLRGDLLITAAEAYMSLGNVSYSRFNEPYFRSAIQYLRRASDIPGFFLPRHLQRYLDNYGRFID